MSLTNLCRPERAIIDESIAGLFFIEESNASLTINNKPLKKPAINQEPVEQSRNSIYLNVNTIQKMAMRLLTEKSMSKIELAETLKITLKNLERILSKRNLSKLKPKINLPLIKLYCGTKWD